MSRITCPHLPTVEEPIVEEQTIEMLKYQIKLPSDFRSDFDLEMDQGDEERKKAEIRRKEEQRLKRVEKLEHPPKDEFKGHRVHAWVIILPDPKGPRSHEISEPFFIEPSSGVAYKLNVFQTNQLYFGVESIWNDINYWVNVQPQGKGCTLMNWDIGKIEFWQHLLPGEPFFIRSAAEIMDDEIRVLQEKHLDMPVSYVDEIRISDQDYRTRYPRGCKTILYKKCKVEWFAPYTQMDGLIERISVYDDYNCTMPLDIYEKYDNRMDNLILSKSYPQMDSVIDYYRRGRADRCKEHQYYMSNNDTVDSERVIEFYSVARIDGLSRIETNSTSLTQYYEDREDRFCYRSVQFSADTPTPMSMQDDVHFRTILCIVEKYERNREVPASRDVETREFDISENEIRLTFHYKDDSYTQATRTYIKPPLAERGERLVLNPSMMQEYNPDPNSKGEKALDLYYELEKQLDDEDRAISQARAAEDEVMAFLKTRREEYLIPQLSTSPFNVARIPESQMDLAVKDDRAISKTDQHFEELTDPLKPYLAQLGNPTQLTNAQAYSLREKCLNHFKQLMVNRANKLLRKIEHCSQELERTQNALTQGEEMTREEEEKILEQSNDLTFQLHVLQVRLNRHRELVGDRYRTLVNQLENTGDFKAFDNDDSIEYGE